jgi:hypothetical protein
VDNSESQSQTSKTNVAEAEILDGTAEWPLENLQRRVPSAQLSNLLVASKGER